MKINFKQVQQSQNHFLQALIFVVFLLSSCATVFEGPVTLHQKKKPAPGKPKREVIWGYVLTDFLMGGFPLIVDFYTGAIYKPKPVSEE